MFIPYAPYLRSPQGCQIAVLQLPFLRAVVPTTGARAGRAVYALGKCLLDIQLLIRNPPLLDCARNKTEGSAYGSHD